MENREWSQTGDHTSVEITGDALVSSIKWNMEIVSTSVCISRVPDELRYGNEEIYIPDIVSIGPFHHGKATLRAMEDQKWRYLYAVLNRKPDLETSLDTCVKALRELEHRARRCYSETVDFTSDEFVQMMLVDGCFIIELFFKYAFKSLRRRSDPVFSKPGMLFDLLYDMVLLENQIPYFVLQRLFQIIPIPGQCSLSLNELAFRFLRNAIPGDQHALGDKFDEEGNHLLDLIRHCFFPTDRRTESNNETQRLNSVTHLQKEGIGFKRVKAKSLLDVKFVKGILEIPPLKIHKRTGTLLGNLIVHEQSHCHNTQYITSYAFLMGSLISSDKDVKLLRRQHILIADTETEKEIPKLFRKLCKDVEVKDFYYGGLSAQVNGYKRTKWKISWPELKHNRPGSIMLGIMAVLLLVLIFVGALFSVLSFCLHHT